MLGIFVGAVFISSFKKVVTDKINTSSEQLINAQEAEIAGFIGNLSNASKLLINSTTIQTNLKERQRGDFPSQGGVVNEIISVKGAYPYITSIYIYDMKGEEIKQWNSPSLFAKENNNIMNAPWYNEVSNRAGKYVIKSGLLMENNEKQISLIRMINDLDNQKSIGLVIVNFNSDELLNSANSDMRDKSCLADSRGNLIAGKSIPIAVKAETGKISMVKQENKVIVSKEIDQNSWILKMEIEAGDIIDELDKIRNVLIICIVVFVSLLVVGTYLIAKSITDPIGRLTKAMREVQDRGFEPIKIQTGRDEIGELFDGFNRMNKEIKGLIVSLIEQENNAKNAELNVMQEQIKPHFLYNTLDMIASLALTDKPENVYNAIESLGRYYRNSLSRGGEIIPLRNEIDIVKDYIELQNLRYNQLFSVDYDVDERLLDIPVLKLMLQPLVENAILHGIRPLGEGGHIVISAIQESGLILSVIDNGIGMSGDKVSMILSEDEKDRRIGLKGTITRIKHYYGEQAKVLIESKCGKGTKITIILKG